MECIIKNKITGVASTNEDTNYPWTNLLDEHPKQWGSADPSSGSPNESTVTLTVSTGSSKFALFNTNAATVNYTLRDSESAIVEQVSFTLDAAKSYDEFISGEVEEVWTFIYHEYPYQLGTHTIELELIGLIGIPVHAGVAVVGITKTFINPQYGLTESLIDYSIEAETNNGSFYYEKREIVRVFAGTLLLGRDRDLYTMMLSLGRDIGKKPLAWQITDEAGANWVIFGRFDKLPSANHKNSAYGSVTFSILEVI